MKILVTGDKGFIARHLIDKLKTEHEIHGYDYHENHNPSVDGYDWAIHLGAISSTTERDVDKVMLQNYEFSKWLFKECNTRGVNFQYASSASVYGPYEKFGEDDPKQPQSPYAWSKYLFDRWVWQQKHNIIVQGMRYFNVYGPREHKGTQASPITKFTKQKSIKIKGRFLTPSLKSVFNNESVPLKGGGGGCWTPSPLWRRSKGGGGAGVEPPINENQTRYNEKQ